MSSLTDRFPPGFFDLPPGAGASLPLDLIAAWVRGPQTAAAARSLVAPHTRRGIVVCSDASGLTRLARERTLLEIFALIGRPKELIHAFGRAIGGRAMGIWAADNTAMYFPDPPAPADVLAMLLALGDRLREECEVGTGLCAHRGTFFELGGALAGPDADRVEGIAEDHTEPGETLLTEELARELPTSHPFRMTPRPGLPDALGPVRRLDDGPRARGLVLEDFAYPVPFSEAFRAGLDHFGRTGRASLVPTPAYREVAVVVAEREREVEPVAEVDALNELALAVAMQRVAGQLLRDRPGREVKTSGAVGYYVLESCGEAVAFAEELRRTLGDRRIRCRIGIDAGRVLLFDLGGGAWDLAGSPVNVASKLGQDRGRFGAILVSAAAARAAAIPTDPARRILVSGVELEAVER